jgi:formylglycine-generating enzyme required for sulfatase activity
MGGFLSRPIALLALLLLASLMIGFSAPLVSAQTIGERIENGVSLASTDSSVLDMRLSKSLSRREEAALKSKDRFRECERCPEMIVVPDGSFIMGANADEAGSTADERPQHRVGVQRFGVGRWPVTSREWEACVMAKGCSHRLSQTADDDNDFATGILWEEAVEYLAWLSRETGRPYRLLSEAEREYVTRAGSSTAFWWGDGADPYLADAFIADLIADIGQPTSAATMPKLQFANPFGLYEVHGRVYDWVEDCWHDDYVGAPSDGSAWTTPDCKAHVLRGGAGGRALQTRRSAARLWFGSPNRMGYMGVRVARTLGP